MAFDGGFLAAVRGEMEQKVVGCRVDKVHQPTRDEIVLHLRSKEYQGKMLLSAGSKGARVQLSEDSRENPAAPPMLCMLLRKRLVGARLTGLNQAGLERILTLSFEGHNELGDAVDLHLVVEMMGRRSNIIFCDADMRVIDAVRRTDAADTVRVLMPGVRYVLPPAQDKIDPVLDSADALWSRLRRLPEQELSKALQDNLQGASPLVCRELAHAAGRGQALRVEQMEQGDWQRLSLAFARWTDAVAGRECHPTMVVDPSGHPMDFSMIPIHQYGMAAVTRDYPDCCSLLDAFFSERERVERMRARSQGLLKQISTLSSRIARRVSAQQAEWQASRDREHLREYGELIKANLHQIERGVPFCEVVNYYTPDCQTVRIPLNIALTPSQNAQKYFKEYRKAHTAEQRLAELVRRGQEELVYIDSVFDALTRAENDRDLNEIREELEQGGYLKSTAKKARPAAKLPPHRFVSDDGFAILVGRNNRQNEQLTLKTAQGNDIWLHVKDGPGAHVIVCCEGNTPPDATLEQAAVLAATYSKASQSPQVAVDYCPARKVKKPQGTPPGMVIYDGYQTAFVRPDPELAKRLQSDR